MIEYGVKTLRVILIASVWLVLAAGTPAIGQQNVHVLFEDNFDLGLQLWPNASSTWDTESGKPISSRTFVAEMIGGHPEWQDIDLVYDLDVRHELGSAGKIQLLFRWQGEWQGYGLILSQTGAEFVRFEGAPRQYQVLARTDRTVRVGERYQVRVALQGRRMTAYLNDQPILQAMDPVQTHRAGQVGMRVESALVELLGMRVTGSPAEPIYDAAWILTRTELDRILDGFPSFEAGMGGEYFPPGVPEAAGVSNIMLIYTHGMSWNYIDALPYVAYGEMVRERGVLPRMEWHDWFFDTFLFLSLLTSDGRAHDSSSRGAPVTWNDWTDFISVLFQPEAQFAAFDRAVAEVKKSLGDDGYRAKVMIMIPYPIPQQTNFGDPLNEGKALNFNHVGQGEEAAVAARTKAVTAYIDRFLAEWNAREYEHLEFVGFYWLSELVYDVPGEREVIRLTGDVIHNLGYHFYWIPFYSAAGYSEWRELNFDAAMLQPNYMFNNRLPRNRLLEASQAALEAGMGIEIEADGTILNSISGRQRYLDYLWGGVKYGYMENAIKAYYQGHDLLGTAFMSTIPEIRAVYDQTYLFIKGLLGKEEALR